VAAAPPFPLGLCVRSLWRPASPRLGAGLHPGGVEATQGPPHLASLGGAFSPWGLNAPGRAMCSFEAPRLARRMEVAAAPPLLGGGGYVFVPFGAPPRLGAGLSEKLQHRGGWPLLASRGRAICTPPASLGRVASPRLGGLCVRLRRLASEGVGWHGEECLASPRLSGGGAKGGGAPLVCFASPRLGRGGVAWRLTSLGDSSVMADSPRLGRLEGPRQHPNR